VLKHHMLLRQKSRTSVVDPDPQCTTFWGLSHSFRKNISLDPNVFHIRKPRIFLSYSSLIPYKHSCIEVLLKHYFFIYLLGIAFVSDFKLFESSVPGPKPIYSQ
jgi:hypothetical protein